MRIKYLMHVYFSHCKKNLATYIFFTFAISLPLLISSFFSDMFDVSMSAFVDDRVIAGDIIIESSLMDNSFHTENPSLPFDAESIVKKAISSVLPQVDEVSYSIYYFLDQSQGVAYVYKDLQNPGFSTSIISSDVIPQGFFVCDQLADLPDTIFVAFSEKQSFTELKRYYGDIKFPRSYQFNLAISNKDAFKLSLPVKKAFIVIELSENIDKETATSLLNLLREDNRLLVLSCLDDPDLVEVARHLISPIFDTHYGLVKLRYRANAAATGFKIIFIASIFFISFYCYQYRKKEYKLYSLIGMKRSRLLVQELIENILDWLIGTILAIGFINLVRISMRLFRAPHYIIDNIGGRAGTLYFDDLYAIDHTFQISVDLKEVLTLALVYLAIYLILGLLVKVGRKST